jgi:hypothetical protein
MWSSRPSKQVPCLGTSAHNSGELRSTVAELQLCEINYRLVETEELNSSNRWICLLTAVGAGINNHSELDVDLYKMACVYTDTMASAANELTGLLELGVTIEEVGDILNGTKSAERGRITVFQSLGKVISVHTEPWFNLFKCMHIPYKLQCISTQNFSHAKTNLKQWHFYIFVDIFLSKGKLQVYKITTLCFVKCTGVYRCTYKCLKETNQLFLTYLKTLNV